MYWISSIERSGPRRSFVKSQKRRKKREMVDQLHCSNEIENCLFAPKKEKCKPFVCRVSKHRYCTTKNPAKRALIWRINGTSIFPRDHSYRRANPATPATLRDHSFASFRKHNPEGFRRSKWNYQVIRGSVTSTGFKSRYLGVRLLLARFTLNQRILNQRILKENVRFLVNIIENLLN